MVYNNNHYYHENSFDPSFVIYELLCKFLKTYKSLNLNIQQTQIFNKFTLNP